MSDRIDQRIVEMSFENHKFEKGINQSKNSLKEFAGALENMGDGKDFKGLENSIQQVSSSFSMLEQIGIGALRRIGDAAVNAGAALIKSLTVDQLSAGLSKYQQKIEAVQTMVSAGYGLDEVEESMQRLMWFSDETSYSFADMAGNMSKFISSGVDLKTSEKSMMGIATWAAHSGKNAAAASIAMFNLSQAISLGYVDTRNWQSIMGQNMNTVMFKQVAIGVAEATGAIKKGQVTIQNFDTDLKTKWFTTDVLNKTLEQYSAYALKVKEVQEEMGMSTADQAMKYMDRHADQYSDVINTIGNAAMKAAQESKSFMDSINATMDAVSTGWMETYEIIFGTLYEAKRNFSALTEILWEVFAASGGVRNDMLRLIKDGGGIVKLFQSIKNVSVAILTPLRAVSEAFDQFFPPKTSTQWLNIIAILETVTESMIITEQIADKIKRTFAGVFAVVDLGWETLKLLGSVAREIVGIFLPLGDGLLDVTASFGDFLVSVNKWVKQSGVFQYALTGIKIAAAILRETLGALMSKIRAFVIVLWNADKPLEFIGKTIQNMFAGTLETLKMITSWISGKFMKALESLSSLLKIDLEMDTKGTIGGFLKILKDFILFLAGKASDGMKTFGKSLVDLDFSKLATFVAGGTLLLFVAQLNGLTKSMTNVLNSTNAFIGKFSKKFFGTTTKIKELAYVFGVLSASIFVLSKIPMKDMKTGLFGLAAAMGAFVIAYGAIQAITVASSKALKGFDVIKSTFNIVSLAAGIAIIAFAITKLNKVANEGDIWKSVRVVGAIMAFLTGYQLMSSLISKIPGQTTMAVKFTGISFGLLGLAAAIAIMDLMPISTIRSGLGKMAVAVLVLAGIQSLFGFVSKISGGKAMSVKMLGITGGILSLIVVMKLLSVINTRELTRGAGNVLLFGGILAAVHLMFGIASKIGGGVKFKTQMISIQMGMLGMVGIIAILGIMDQTKIQNGIKIISKMAILIGGLELVTAISSKIAGGKSVQRILGSVTLTMFSFTALFAVLNIYTDDEIDRGLLTISKMLGIITAFEVLMAITSRISGSGKSLSFMLGMTTSLLAVTASLLLLGAVNQESLRQASVSLGIAVIAVGIMAVGIGVLVKSLSLIGEKVGGTLTFVKKIIPGLAILGVTILSTLAFLGILAIASTLIDKVSWSNLGKFVIGIGVISVLVANFALLSSNPLLGTAKTGLTKLIPGFVAMGLVVLATAGLFAILGKEIGIVDNISWSSFAKFIIGLGLVSIMTAKMALLGPVLVALGPAFLPAIGGVLTAIVGVGLIIGAFVGAAKLIGLLDGESLISGIDKLVIVGKGIGRFIGAMAGGFKAEVMIGYGEGLSGFANAVGDIKPEAFAGVESLARALLILSGGALLDRMSNLFNHGIFKSRKNPGTLFGEKMQGLVKGISMIDIAKAEKAGLVLAVLGPMAENLTELANATRLIPNTGGVSGWFMGENDADIFGQKIEGFVKAFAKTSPEEAEYAAKVLDKLKPLGTDLKTFAKNVENIPNSGGFIGAFMGNNDVDTFGVKLSELVATFNGIPEASITIASATMVAMKPMMENLKTFAGVASDIPESSGVVTWFTGDNDIKKFVKKIIDFTLLLGEVKEKNIAKASNNIQILTRDVLPGLSGFANLANNINYKKVDDLVVIAKKIKDFTNILKNANLSELAPAINNLKDINNAFGIIGGTSVVNAATSFNNNKSLFQTSVTDLLDDIVGDITSRKKPVETSFTDVIGNALKQGETYEAQFATLGGNLMTGLERGVNKNQGLAISAISKMTRDATSAARAGFKIKSPSKVFEEIGGWLGLGLGKGITNNSGVAVLAGINMAEGVEDGIRNTLDVHSLSDKFKAIGEWITKSVGGGINKGKSFVLGTAEEFGIDTTKITVKGMVDGLSGGEGVVTTGINSLIDILSGTTTTAAAEDGGNSIGGAFADGLGGSTGKVAKTAKDLADEAFKAFKEQMDYLMEYELITPEIELSKWREYASQQAEGSLNQLRANKKVAELSFEYSKTWIDKEKYYKKLSLEDELAAWIRVQNKKEITNAQRLQADREVFRLREELMQNEYQNAIEYIEEEKYYNRMSKNEELMKMREIQLVFEDNAEMKKKTNREIFRLEQEIAKETLEYEKEIAQVESDRIGKRDLAAQTYFSKAQEFMNEEKHYDKMALADELKAWKQIQQHTDIDSEQRKQANREVYRVQKEINIATEEYYERVAELEKDKNEKRKKAEDDYYSKTKSTQEKLKNDIKSLTDAYESAIKSRTEALYSAWGLFDTAEIPQVDGEELLKNLEGQVVAFDQWQAQLDKLSAKGVSDGLINELRDMGPKSLSQIVALNTLASPQLDKYVALWGKKSVEARDQATLELEGMKADTDLKIRELTTIAQQELLEYENVWKATNAEINDATSKSLQLLQDKWDTTMTETNRKIDAKLGILKNQWNESLKVINTETEEELIKLEASFTTSVGKLATESIEESKKLRKDFGTEIKGIVTDTATQMVALEGLVNNLKGLATEAIRAAITAKASADEASKALASAQADARAAGNQVSAGFAKGIDDNSKQVGTSATKIGEVAANSLNRYFRIESPSKRTMETGKYFVAGLANGILKFSDTVFNASSYLGDGMMGVLSSAMTNISDVINSDEEFKITPILDLTNVRSGIDVMNSMFGSGRELEMATAMSMLPNTNKTNQNGILTDIRDGLLSMGQQEMDLTGVLTVQVSNDKGEITGIAEMAIKDILRRESR